MDTLNDAVKLPWRQFLDTYEPLRLELIDTTRSAWDAEDRPTLTAYFERLRERAPFTRVLREAEPFMKYFPG